MTLDDLPGMALVAASYLAMFGAGEVILRLRLASSETTRRMTHAAAGLIALLLPVLFDSALPVLALAAPFVAFLAGTMVLGLLRSVHGVSRRSVGAFVYPVAIAATFVLAADQYAIYAAAVLALALADPAGGVVGVRAGRHRYPAWSVTKSWEGSLAVFVVTLAIVAAALGLGGTPATEALAGAVYVGLVVALVEGALPWGVDNLGIPIATAAALLSLGSIAASAVVVVIAVALFGSAIAWSRPARSSLPVPSVPAIEPDAN